MTWNDFFRPEILPASRGMFAKLSPSGRYLASSTPVVDFSTTGNIGQVIRSITQ